MILTAMMLFLVYCRIQGQINDKTYNLFGGILIGLGVIRLLYFLIY
jgi:hypothetical protein